MGRKIIDKLYKIAKGLNARFPDGDDPFMIVTRLTEGCGEAAAQVNHFERQQGRETVAKELHVMRAVLHLALYGLEAELERSVDETYRRVVNEGLVEPLDDARTEDNRMNNSHTHRDELLDQFLRSFKMLQAVLDNIPAQQWLSGTGGMSIPAVIAYHTVESLDFYFCGKIGDDFGWGHRFGAPWWELPRESLPTKENVVTYLQEVEEQAREFFAGQDDDDLLTPFELYDWSGGTMLGHLVYALRHTMHHQGQLALLQLQFGVEGDTWS